MASLLSRLTGYPFFSREWSTENGIPDLSGKVSRRLHTLPFARADGVLCYRSLSSQGERLYIYLKVLR